MCSNSGKWKKRGEFVVNMYRWFVIPILVIVCVAVSSTPQYAFSADQQAEDNELTTFIQQLFAKRAQYLLHQEDGLLRDFYMPERASSMRAMKHEQMRAQYVQTWVKHRHLRLADAASSPRVIRANKRNDQVLVSAVDSLRLGYTYNQPSSQVEYFGIGTRHALTLMREKGSWKVLREWYLDPLEENPDLIPKLTEQPRNSASNRVNAMRNMRNQASGSHSTSTRYNRGKAIDYANKYAGIAWGAGNKHRYNPKYRDYTGQGGDCTNFASQCIGDQEGGGLRMRGGWHHYRSGGSRAWVQTDAFKNFLIYSGYGKVIKKGTYTGLVQANNQHPNGAWASLKAGDLIGYELNGDIDHFSIVVGFDAQGYPLVNSHTADRYRVPFDLGWDKYTMYWLIHIRD